MADPTAYKTEAHRLLAQFFETYPHPVAKFAIDVGTTYSTVTRWRYKGKTPTQLAVKERVATETRGLVPVAAWKEKPKRGRGA